MGYVSVHDKQLNDLIIFFEARTKKTTHNGFEFLEDAVNNFFLVR